MLAKLDLNGGSPDIILSRAKRVLGAPISRLAPFSLLPFTLSAGEGQAIASLASRRFLPGRLHGRSDKMRGPFVVLLVLAVLPNF